MKKVRLALGGLIGGIINVAIYSLVEYTYLYKLGAPDGGFLLDFITLSLFSSFIELIIVSITTGISGVIGMFVSDIISDHQSTKIIRGVICVIFGINLFINLGNDGFSMFYRVIFAGGIALSGVKQILTRDIN